MNLGRSRADSLDGITAIPMTNMTTTLDKTDRQRRFKKPLSKSPLSGLQVMEQALVFKGEFSPSTVGCQ